MAKPVTQAEPTVDEQGFKLDVKGIELSSEACPMDGCDGTLTKRYKINREPQYAIACNRCEWWTLT